MANMKSDTLLDYAVFQLSPKRSRCELFVSSDGSTEKLASGLLKPFISHLQIAEEQVASAAQSIKLDVGRYNKAETWFTKGTLERFVRFVSTPEVLELVNTLDAEMSQLEAARRIYSQGAGGQLFGGGGFGVTSGDDATKKELLRAMDVRLIAVLQDLSTACARAAAAGFNIDTVSELQIFADKFGAHRLNEACAKFISLKERRPELTQPWKSGPDDRAVRSSYGSDMSIDDDPPSPPPRQQPATFHHPDPPASTSGEAGNKPVDAVPEKDNKDEGSTPDQTGSIQASQPARRLSVQDRINMFENKQKENSGGKPVVVVKPVELRRISSDLSAASGAAVLRRWSGASDMSIDLSSDKRDTESPTCTPVSTAFSQDKKVSNLNDGAAENSSKVIPGMDRAGEKRLKGATFINSDQSFESNSNSISGERDVLKDRVGGVTRSKSFERTEDQESSEGSFNTLAAVKVEGLAGLGDQGKLKGYLSGEETQMTGVKNQVSSTTHDRSFLREGREEIETANGREGSRDERVREIRVKATQKTAVESGVIEGGPGSRILKAFASRYKVIEGDSSSNQKAVRSVGETEVAEKKESHLSEKDDSGPQRLKFNRQRLAAELSKKALVQREKTSSSGNIGPQLSGKVEAHECVDSFSTPPPEASRVRQSKGNQELNDNLKTKAGELEKLFAEHKLRVLGENSNSARKGRLGDAKLEASSSLHHTKPVADIDGQYDGDAISGKFSDLSVSEGSRGKFYDRYMQIRDEKLRGDWSANRGEKEAKLKHLQDSLERNRSEMKAKFSGSADRPDTVSSAHRRAEQIRSYNSRPIMKREQPGLNFWDSDEEALDFPAQNQIHEISSGEVSRGSQGKKHVPNNKKLSTPPTLSAPVPRSGMKTSASGKRRMIPENPLAQSVPNLLDMRKENTKPSSGSNKATRSQVKSIARSKSISDEAAVVRAIVREDKSCRSQSLRKSSVNSSDLRQISPEESDGACLAPLNFDDEILKNAVTKPFLKKSSRTSFVARTTETGEKASGVSELIKPEEENCDVESAPDDFVITGKDEEEEFESLNSEGQNSMHNGETKQGLEQEKFANSGSENGDGALTFSLVDQALGSKLPIESVPDWSGESPVSWNSHTQHTFSYPHEMSDVDAPVYSSVGSPASWNSHSVNQIETNSARTRKKWGTTQKPMLAVHSSSNQSRKDVTRGFKRLLKFGRKSRGSESLVDWISATTSEGDDDTDDGRDPSNRLTDDLRKSRMGSSHAQASEDSFNGSEFINGSVQSSQKSIPAPPANFKLREDHISESSIKAPRSFFSLSSFRSKGSDSKIR